MNVATASSQRIFRAMYAMAFMFSLSYAIPMYMSSSFLEQFTTSQIVSVVYTLGSIATLIMLGFMPKILTRFGNFKTMMTVSALEILSLVGLAFTHNIFFLAPIFILYLGFETVLSFNFDMFVEYFSKDSATGRIRGTFLTVNNLAVLISPLIAGLILENNEFWKLYLLAGGILIVMMILLANAFHNFKDPRYDHVPVWSTLRHVWHNPDIHHVFIAGFLLKMFFAWMVIYTPIYLHEYIGFDWATIGLIFTIMLLPYVLFELPVGKLADTWWGEKEIMTIGFIVMGLSTIAILFITGPVFWLWALVLFMTRVGASFVEITTESYFFKHVAKSDSNTISFFRDANPVAYIIGPMLGSLFLIFLDFKYLFLVLGLIMIYGTRYSWTIHDTK